MKHFITVVSIAAILILAVGAMAGASDSSYTVSVNVPGRCFFASFSSYVDFGEYDTISPDPQDGLGLATFYCSKGTVYWFYITGDRIMTTTNEPIETLKFDLYKDPARTERYPEVRTGNGETAQGSYNISKPFYGRIPAGQSATIRTDTFKAVLIIHVDW